MNRILVPSLIALLPFVVSPATAETTSRAVTTTTTSTTLAAAPTTAPQSPVVTRLSAMFSTFAGSSANAQSLVTGLRNGTQITLTDSNGTTSFTPATGHMGWGNVKIALALAQAELAQAGVTNPTQADIQAALNGGSVTNTAGTTTTFTGVLTQRASGMGWGKIAQAQGLKLGPVVSGLRTTAGTGAASASTVHTRGVVTAGLGTGVAAGRSGHEVSSTITTASGTSTNVTAARHGRAPAPVITTASGTTTAATTGAAQRTVASSNGNHGQGTGSVTTAGNAQGNGGANRGRGHGG